MLCYALIGYSTRKKKKCMLNLIIGENIGKK